MASICESPTVSKQSTMLTMSPIRWAVVPRRISSCIRFPTAVQTVSKALTGNCNRQASRR